MNSEILDKVKSIAAKLDQELRVHRHHLHAHPELSFKEYNTSEYIQRQLDALKIPYKAGVAGTGIVGEIKGEHNGPTIALRADMDALPIHENNKDKDYRSSNEGVMHACGHDVHMTSLLGAANILSQLKSELHGTIRLIFQPGEELLPGGASLMIKENVLDGVSCIVGQHVQPSMETGTTGFREGMYMASTDELRMRVNGKGGHAAMPADYKNPVVALSEFILVATERFMGVNKNVPDDLPTVLAFGRLEADGATNVIPGLACAEGTFRTMNEEWRAEAHQILTDIALEISKKHGIDCQIEISKGYPFLVNDHSITGTAKQAAINYLGVDKVDDLPIRMTAEDFAWYTQKIPGCFYRLGTGNKKKGICSGVHTPDFDIDEDALVIGAGLMSFIALELLNGGK
jgi:amidohydrolase